MQRSLDRRARPSGLLTVLFLGAIAWGVPRAARADDVESAATIAKLTKRALEDYENLNFDAARHRLAFALEECSRLALTRHAVAAQAHMLMGVVILSGGDKERADAITQFAKAIDIDSTIKLPESLANPELQQAFNEAAKSEAADGAAEPAEAPSQPKRLDTNVAHVTGPAKDANEASGVVEAEAADEEAPRARSWFIGVGVGGGLGWTSGVGEVTDARVDSGFHAAPLAHVLPEVGYFVRPDVLLSVQLRVQFLSGASSEPDPTMTMCGADHLCSPSKGATAVFAKGTWFLKGASTFRPYLSGLIGAGHIRHLVGVPGSVTCGTDPAQPKACIDTVAAGPVFVGPGAGVAIHLTPAFALLVGANTLLGFSHFTFHVDLNAGAALEF